MNEEAKESKNYLRSLPGSGYNDGEKNRQPKTNMLEGAESSEGKEKGEGVEGGSE